ncbi:hypothetical protein HBH64_003220 [Parastagonospora nodorum]|nr:hypothetical protein HBH49_222090 [Parastagonospora nodorum]KAH4074450.1 hypothetical protein HBH50_025620 [Parastagonospora nodorum]KAH4096509.1 hypothetical protein HBH48_034490 [Parastagonospora nodorum]KAH4203383.1 hypothetical protein HBH42_000740 [Parastagonospora nodorum]KAH4312928.1 hypothetical protein HBI01_000760 [Parastagonospora nodorum]
MFLSRTQHATRHSKRHNSPQRSTHILMPINDADHFELLELLAGHAAAFAWSFGQNAAAAYSRAVQGKFETPRGRPKIVRDKERKVLDANGRVLRRPALCVFEQRRLASQI